MAKKLNDRIARLERALPKPPTEAHPYWEEFGRRVRISEAYMARRNNGEAEKPELADPRDLEQWEHMEMVWRTAKKIALRRAEAEERHPEADGWYADEEA